MNDQTTGLSSSALTLYVEQQEGHPTHKNPVDLVSLSWVILDRRAVKRLLLLLGSAFIITYCIITKRTQLIYITCHCCEIVVSSGDLPFSMPGMRVVLNCRSYCQEHSGIVLLTINYTQHHTTHRDITEIEKL